MHGNLENEASSQELYMWWAGLEAFAKSSSSCAAVKQVPNQDISAPTELAISTVVASTPQLCWPASKQVILNCHRYTLEVGISYRDAYNDYRSSTLIFHLWHSSLSTDNGPRFTSAEFTKLLRN